MTPLVIIVGADKGGVGKTQICRLLRDYLEKPALKDFPRPRLLDGQFPRGDLSKFHPDAEVINITSIADQMKIFDTLEGVTLTDIPAGQLGTMLEACNSAMLFEDVKNGTLRMALLHVLGPSVSSLDEISDAVRMLGTSAKHFVVKNHINETNFFEWDQDSKYATSLRALENITISIPHLTTIANEAVQQAQEPFVQFAGSKSSRTLRGHVVSYLDAAFAEFDRVGLGSMIQDTFR